MVRNYSACQAEAAVSSHTPLPTALTIPEPYHDLNEVVTVRELTLLPDGNALFCKQSTRVYLLKDGAMQCWSLCVIRNRLHHDMIIICGFLEEIIS